MIHRAVPWQGWDRSDIEEPLKLLSDFQFGDTYCVQFLSGVTVEVDNFDRFLEAVVYEFKHSNDFYPMLEIQHRVLRTPALRVAPVPVKGDVFGIEELEETIKSLVTTFNLSGDWDEGILDAYTDRRLAARGYPRG